MINIKLIFFVLMFLIVANTITIAINLSAFESFTTNHQTINNYIEAYSDRAGIFRDRNYPTSNLSGYHPGPNPYMYLLYLAWEINKYFELNVIIVFRVLMALYPITILSIIFYFLYRAKLFRLLLSSMIMTLIIPFGNNLNPLPMTYENPDLGTNHLAYNSFALVLVIIYSTYNRNSSHLLLFYISAVTIHMHFSTVPLGSFALLYSFYLIYKSKKRAKFLSYLIIAVISITPLISRVIKDPLYILNSIKINSSNIVNSSTIENNKSFGSDISLFVEYLYSLSPFGLLKCDTGSEIKSCGIINLNISLIIFLLFLLSVVIFLFKNSNIFEKILISVFCVTSFYQLFTSYEPNHGAFIVGIFYGIVTFFISKIKYDMVKIFSIFVITFAIINADSIVDNRKISTIFSNEFSEIIKNEKFMINICNIYRNPNLFCDKKDLVYLAIKNNKTSEYLNPNNFAKVFLLELFKNGNDVCIFPIEFNYDTYNNLRCTEEEINDINRTELLVLNDINLSESNRIGKYHKVAYFKDDYDLKCNSYTKLVIKFENKKENNNFLKINNSNKSEKLESARNHRCLFGDHSASLYFYNNNYSLKFYQKLLNSNLNHFIKYKHYNGLLEQTSFKKELS